jgi:hypothetical protein
MSIRVGLVAMGLVAGMTAAQGLAQTTNAPAAAASAQPPATQTEPPTYTVPAGTKVLLSLKSGINTKTAQQGDGVYLVSAFPVVGGSQIMIPVGVYVQGVVDRVQRPGRVKGRAQLDLHFTTMIFPNGQVIEVPGVLNSLPGSDGPKVKDSEGTVEQAGNKGRDVGNVLKGAAIGAEGGVIGGAATGDLAKGVGYGSLAGAAMTSSFLRAHRSRWSCSGRSFCSGRNWPVATKRVGKRSWFPPASSNRCRSGSSGSCARLAVRAATEQEEEALELEISSGSIGR